MSPLTVLYFVLPFPLAFILHDAEEIAMEHKWMLKHQESLSKRFPRMRFMLEHLASLDTKAFAIAAAEELLILLLITAWVLVDGAYATELWSAVFIAFSAHLVMHIGQGVIVREYVPGLVTSILLLPFAVYVIMSIWNAYSVTHLLLLTLLGLVIMVANLLFAHWFGLSWKNDD